jgi:hypothetical protein
MRYSFFIPFKGADNKFVRTNVKLYGHAFIKIYNYDVDLRHFCEFAAGPRAAGAAPPGVMENYCTLQNKLTQVQEKPTWRRGKKIVWSGQKKKLKILKIFFH